MNTGRGASAASCRPTEQPGLKGSAVQERRALCKSWGVRLHMQCNVFLCAGPSALKGLLDHAKLKFVYRLEA